MRKTLVRNNNKNNNQKSMKGNSRFVLLFSIIAFLLIIGIWVSGWIVTLNSSIIKNEEVSKAGEIFDSISALFSGLAFFGLLVTIILQKSDLKLQREELKLTREELQKSSEANISIANDNNERAILDLYQSFTTEYFEKIRQASWKVLSNCIKSKDYCDYVVDSFFVSETRKLPEEIILKIRTSYPENKYGTIEKVRIKETSDRIKLDLLLNFFNLLAKKKDVTEVIKNCDFYYDSYRPLFWWILYFREKKYYESEKIKKYSSKPFWIEMLRLLDDCYGHEKFITDDYLWEYLVNHPTIVRKEIDDKYGFNTAKSISN